MCKNLFQTFTFLALLVLSNTIVAQNSDSPKLLSNVYYLQNCFVVKQPGTILSGQSVIIRDGFVSEVGPGLNIPFDAQVIKADSMYVYAGFIAGYSNTGIAKPENRERPKITDPGNPPNDVAGITPQLEATDFFKSSDKSVTEMRTAGFGISHIAPRGLMLPGNSAIYLLGEGSNDKLLVKAGTNQNFQLEANRGSYP
ncbi:MAG: hypothetical protein WAU01_01465, partial [Saprospiraceae bacterium]